MKKLFFLLIISSTFFCPKAQTVKLLTSGTKTNMRGLSVVSDKVVWASGSNGTVALSVDGGANWKWMTVKGYEKTDFRDIEAFDKKSAIIMGIDSPAYILRTVDGGENWTKVYQNNSKGMFLDAMEFWNEQSGIVIGDPIGGRFFISRTFDGGVSWQDLPFQKRPVADSGEACFASSGTNIRKLNRSEAIFISGGLISNVFIRDKKIKLPLLQGKESTGANSIAVKDNKTFMMVGGDFNTKDSSSNNCTYTMDGGKTWLNPLKNPTGYRSCVEFLGKKKWITCGLNGVDISVDEGKNFANISSTGFHVVRRAKKGKAVFFAGGGGRIGKLVE